MENEHFIELIRTRPSLWDKNSVQYFNTILKNDDWNEVGAEMQFTGPEARYKWKCLRDSFNREWRKPEIRDSTFSPRWIHFQSMLFLKDVVSPRLKKGRKLPKRTYKKKAVKAGNITVISTKPKSTEFVDESFAPDAISIPISNENIEQTNIYSFEEIDEGYKIPKEEPEMLGKDEEFHSSDGKEYDSLQQKQEESTFRNEDTLFLGTNVMEGKSDDHHFLLSLLPTLQDLPLQKKMLVKLEIQKLLYEATFNTSVELKPSSIWMS